MDQEQDDEKLSSMEGNYTNSMKRIKFHARKQNLFHRYQNVSAISLISQLLNQILAQKLQIKCSQLSSVTQQS